MFYRTFPPAVILKIMICLGWALGGPGQTGLGAWGGPAKAGPPGAFNKGAPGPGTLLKALCL